MKANKSHISLETAKLLKDCGDIPCTKQVYENGYVSETGALVSELGEGVYPLFTWQEIEDNAELFFGKKVKVFNDDGFQWGEWEMCAYHPIQLLLFRQQKKYEEADLYFREHNILTNKA